MLNKEFRKEELFELVHHAMEQLCVYPVWENKDYVKYYIKKLLGQNPPQRNRFFWPQGILTMGLAEYDRKFSSDETLLALKQYYSKWKNRGCPLHYVDDAMNGYGLLYLQEKTGEWKSEIIRMKDMLLNHPVDADGSLLYRTHCPSYVFADTIGMVVPFLSIYGKQYKDEAAVLLAEKQIQNFLKCGMDEHTGLPCHGYDSKTREKYGIIGWGRAVGWLLLGMAFYIRESEQPDTQIVKQFREILVRVMKYQNEEGHFTWQIAATDGHVDSSATAMICYAMQVGISTEYMPEVEYEAARCSISKGITALKKDMKNGRVANCSGECLGFGLYPQVYASYPWADGMTLALLSSTL